MELRDAGWPGESQMGQVSVRPGGRRASARLTAAPGHSPVLHGDTGTSALQARAGEQQGGRVHREPGRRPGTPSLRTQFTWPGHAAAGRASKRKKGGNRGAFPRSSELRRAISPSAPQQGLTEYQTDLGSVATLVNKKLHKIPPLAELPVWCVGRS